MTEAEETLAALVRSTSPQWSVREIRFLSEPGSPWVEIDVGLGGPTERVSILADMVAMVTIYSDVRGGQVEYEVLVWCVGAPARIIASYLSREQADEIAAMIRAEVTIRRSSRSLT